MMRSGLARFAALLFFCCAGNALSIALEAPFSQLERHADDAKTADRVPEAISLYERAVVVRPSWSEGWWSLGTLYYDADLFAEAQNALTHFVATAPKPAPGFALLGLCDYETQDYDRAMAHFQAWGKAGSPGTKELIAVAVFHWALLLTRRGEFEQALYFLTGEARKGSNSPEMVEALGLASLRMTYLPTELPPQMREVIFLAGKVQLATVLRQMERAGFARKRLLQRYGSTPNVHSMLGTADLELHDRAAAILDFKRELDLTPTDAWANMQLAECYLNDFQPEMALPYAQRAVEANQNSFSTHYTLGLALLALKRFDECLLQLELSRKLAPENPYIRFSLANAYAALGRHADAELERTTAAQLKEKEHRVMEQAEGVK